MLISRKIWITEKSYNFHIFSNFRPLCTHAIDRRTQFFALPKKKKNELVPLCHIYIGGWYSLNCLGYPLFVFLFPVLALVAIHLHTKYYEHAARYHCRFDLYHISDNMFVASHVQAGPNSSVTTFFFLMNQIRVR